MTAQDRERLEELLDMDHLGGIDVPFTRRAHDRLASEGWIEVRRHDHGARITITDAGREALERDHEG